MQATAKNIMTKDLMTIPAGSPIASAISLMQTKRFRHLPVVNEAQEIVGILSQRDIRCVKKPDLIPVDYIMTSPVIFVDQNVPLRSAIFKLVENKISSLLIADEDQNAVGIITTDDLMWYLTHLLDEAKERRFSFSSLFDLQTVGEAAKLISNAGL